MLHRNKSPKADVTGHATGVASLVAARLEAGVEDSIGQVAVPFIGADVGVAAENAREKLSALVVRPGPQVVAFVDCRAGVAQGVGKNLAAVVGQGQQSRTNAYER